MTKHIKILLFANIVLRIYTDSGLIRYSHCTGLPAVFTKVQLKFIHKGTQNQKLIGMIYLLALGERDGVIHSLYESQKIDKMKVIKEDMKIVSYS